MAERTESHSEGGTHRSSRPQSAEPGKDATQDEIVADIEETRAQLRDTVDSLSSKLDVKANAKARLDEAKQSAMTTVSDLKQRVLDNDLVRQARAKPAIPAAAAAGLVIVVIGVVVWRRRDTRPQPVRAVSGAARAAGRRSR